MKAKKISRMAMWLALVSVFSLISIPIGTVPITLQIFALFLMSAFLTPFESAQVMIAYLAIGALGTPVFAGFQSGVGVLLGPTGGYLWAFPLAAFVASVSWRHNGIWRITSLALSLLSIYALGVAFLTIYVGSFTKAVEVGVLPFIWIDALKITVVYFVLRKLCNVVPSLSYMRKIETRSEPS